MCSLILFLGVGNIPGEIWSISKGCPPHPPTPPPPPTPSFNYKSMPRLWEPIYCSLHLDIEVEGTIFAFGFSKKYDISLLSIECRVLDQRRAFDRLACVEAYLCSQVRSELGPSVEGHCYSSLPPVSPSGFPIIIFFIQVACDTYLFGNPVCD